ncbi:WYL domain-containing protein [Methanogenium organophilum]|uniref:WYL domain-containing protein n=1 Tax=Methanogenium organophilum TaxID=2199 RepID=A0A9X9T8L0_METOG|nr:hypothetical protein [Methanogenium organophilum]WAI01556.1 hypothetical protein OU421_01400 [Methanogenium organophilum]
MSEPKLCNAIKSKKQVNILYDGQIRKINPHLIGINEKGNKALRAFQVGGYSKSGNLPAWKLYLLNEIRNVQVLDTTFSTHPQYNPNDNAMIKFVCRI